MKLWAGRTSGSIDELADKLNKSIGTDSRMYRQDILGSIAHAQMLGKQGIIPKDAAERIVEGLNGILADIESDALEIDMTSEDIHTFVEATLTERIGEAGKMLHTARSRNDQVALDTRMYVRDEIDGLQALVRELIETLCRLAEENQDTIMPGYTHLQRAQPILFSHQLMAYASMLDRDFDRLGDCRKRVNVCPIGSCALAGTTYDTDREYEAQLLGFSGPCANSIDGVSDRDFCVELMSDLAMLQMHLSRFAEELILWTSWEFRFIAFADAYTTGSSIMPQKKNSDMAELVRGKTGRVYGDLVTLLTALKGLPLAYNKDMQEDKEVTFDAIDTVKLCLQVMIPMLATMTVNSDNMLRAAQTGFINATDLADYLTRKGMPFRTAYKLCGEIVQECADTGMILEQYPLEKYREKSDLFEEDVYNEINLAVCVDKRISQGGTGKKSVLTQIDLMRKKYMGTELV